MVQRIAVGGMAEVYVAEVESPEPRRVAIKLIHPRYAEDPQFVQMLVNEARLSVLLTHVNIAQTYDLGEINGKYFIVMEYVEGADTHRILKRTKKRKTRLPLDLCAHLASELCHGLDYAHRKRTPDGEELRIVHRDVSPQNVLVSFSGEVKIADFGIAKATQRSEQTQAGVIKGKYYYMSPEQAWADPVDARSDVFSAGLVLHELLTGEMAYGADNLPALLEIVRAAELSAPSKRRKGIPPELDEICMRALDPAPSKRFQSAQEMAQALSRFVYRTRPTFSSARVAALMAELFPDERKRARTKAKLPAGERVLLPHSGERYLDETRPDPVLIRARSVAQAKDFEDETTSSEVPRGRVAEAIEAARRAERAKAARARVSPFDDDSIVDDFDELTQRAPQAFALSAEFHQDNDDEDDEDATEVALGLRAPDDEDDEPETEVAAKKRKKRRTAASVGDDDSTEVEVDRRRGDDEDTEVEGDEPRDSEAPEAEEETRLDALSDLLSRADSIERDNAARAAAQEQSTLDPFDEHTEQTEGAPLAVDAGSGSLLFTLDGKIVTREESVTTPLPLDRFEAKRADPDPSGPSGAQPDPSRARVRRGEPSPFADFDPTPYETPAEYPAPRRSRLIPVLFVGVLALALGGFIAWRALSGGEPVAAPSVEVVSDPPGATLDVNGTRIEGVTPITLPDARIGQRLRLEARQDGYQPWRREVVVEPGASRHIAVLEPIRHDVRIETTPPGAQVEIDGRPVGPSPVVLQDRTVGQTLRLRVRKSGYQSLQRDLEVLDSDAPFHFELQRE
ncbi:MAG: serine/threonine-protein kinase [Myxococcota bacterium]